jgi:Domain of Unknown Function (DUF1206)
MASHRWTLDAAVRPGGGMGPGLGTASGKGVQTTRAARGLARVGLGARASIYLVVAYLCFELAAGRPAAQADTQGAFQAISRQRGGTALLIVLAFGLAAYALWRFHQAVFGSVRDHGSWWPRVGAVTIGVVYSFLLANVVELLGTGAAASGGSKPAPLAASVLRWPGGAGWLAAGAVAIGFGGVVFAVWGARRDLNRVLDRDVLSDGWWRTARATNALGDAGRGAVACLLAGALFSAAVDGRPGSAKGIGQLLDALRHASLGPAAVDAIAVAFVAYAAFSVIELVAGRF